MIAIALTMVAWGAALAVLAPAGVLFIQTIGSLLPRQPTVLAHSPNSIAVIIPAHNEGPHITATIQDALAGLRESDRLIVVADNCTDDTAAIAQRLGAEVIVRNDPQKRGKGYALQFAIDHLRSSPPECVAFFDADCRFGSNAITVLAANAWSLGRPAQALYLMQAPLNASPRLSVSAFAWLMINRVRMTGLFNLAGVTRFTGSGMAAPWKAVSNINFATGAITEDLLLTFKLAEQGTPPALAADVEVTSQFPEADEASVTQRARWEHGSLQLLLQNAIPAFFNGLLKLDLKRMMMALDVMIPPLIMFAVLLMAAMLLTAALSPFIGVKPLMLALLSALLFASSIIIGWLSCGREVLPLRQVGAVLPFILEKFQVYGRRGRASSKTWTRTKRQEEE